MTDRIRKILNFLIILALAFENIFLYGSPVFAVTTAQIRHEINILDSSLNAATNAAATSSERIYFDPSKYSGRSGASGGITAYFEIVASSSASFSNTISLVRTDNGTTDCTISASLTTSWQLLRSAACTIPAVAEEYVVRVNPSASGSTRVRAARLIVLQSIADTATNATSTETQIEIGNTEIISGATGNSTSTLSFPKYWWYDSSKWDGSVSAYAEVTYQVLGGVMASSSSYRGAGTYTVTMPGGTASSSIGLWGGGGSGGSSTLSPGGGAGGAGGQFASSTFNATTTSYTLVVAAGGTAPTTPNPGNQGGTSTWSGGLIIAGGGGGGKIDAGGTTTATSFGCVGWVCFAGGSSGNGQNTATQYGGGGGGGADSLGAGNSGTLAGVAGTAKGFGGAGAVKNTTGSSAGTVGGTSGGGGSGGNSGNATDRAGGAGGPGRAEIYNRMATTTIVLQSDDGAFGSWTDVPGTYMVDAGDVGNASSTRYRSGAFTLTNQKHYRLAYKKGDNRTTIAIQGAKIIVDSYAGVAQVGNDYTFLSNNPYLTSLSSSRVAFSLSNGDLTTMNWDGSTWTNVGNTSTVGVGNWPSAFAGLSSTRVAIVGTNPFPLTVLDFNGTDWSTTGSSLNLGTVSQITALSSSRVAVYGSIGGPLKTYDFDGSSWSQVGSTLTLTASMSPLMAALSSTRIAFYNAGTSALAAYDFDGSTWSKVGNTLTLSNGTAMTAANGTLYILVNGTLKAYTFDGTNFTLLSSPNYAIPNGNTSNAIATLTSSPFSFAFAGRSAAKLQTYSMSSGFTEIEPQYLLANTNILGGTALQNYLTKWDTTEWSGVTNTYQHAVAAAANSTSVVELDTSGGSQLSGSAINAPKTYATSTAVTMPATNNLDVKVTTNNLDIYSSSLIVQTTLAQAALTISGNIYTDRGTTLDPTGGRIVKVAVGTSTPGIFTVTTAGGASSWSVGGLSGLAIGNPIVAWVAGDPTFRATTFTKLNSASAGPTNVDLYKNRVVVSHEASSATTSRIADMLFYDGANDSDIQYDVNSGVLNIANGEELYVDAGKTFAPGASVTINGNAAAAPDGDLYIANGAIYTAPAAATTTIAGSFTNLGTFTAGANGTTTFSATTTGKTISGSATGTNALGNVLFSGAAGGWTFSVNASTTNLWSTAGTVALPTLTSVGGNFLKSGTMSNSDNSTSIFYFSGTTGSQAISSPSSLAATTSFIGAATKVISSASSPSIANLVVDSTSGTVTLPSTLFLTGNYTNNGTVNANSGLVDFLVGNQTITGNLTGTSAFNNLSFDNSGTKYFANNASTTGDFVINGVTIAAPSLLSVGGGFTNNGGTFTKTGTAGVLYFNGTSGTQTLTGTLTGASALGTTTFLGAAAKTFSATNASTSQLTIDATSGTVTAPSGILTVSGSYTNNGTFANNGGAVYFDSPAIATLSGNLKGTSAFNSMVLNGTGFTTISSSASTTLFQVATSSANPVTVNGQLSVLGDYYSQSDYDPTAGSSAILYFSGTSGTQHIMRRNGNVLQLNFATTTFTGAAAKSIEAQNGVDYNSLVVDASSGTVTMPAGAESFSGKNFVNNGTIIHQADILSIYNNGLASAFLYGNMTGVSAFLALTLNGYATFLNDASTTGQVTISLGSTLVAPRLFSVGDSFSNSGTYVASTTSGSNLFFNSNSATQLISGTLTGASALGSTTFIGAGAKTLSNDASTTDFLIASTSGNVSSSALLSVGGNFENRAARFVKTGTAGGIYFSGTGATQNILGYLTGSSTLATTTFLGAAAKTFAANASTSDFNILSDSGRVTLPTLLSIEGSLTASNGKFSSSTAPAGMLYLSGPSSAQTISGYLTGSSTLGTTTIKGAATKTFSSNASTTDFTISSGSGQVTLPSQFSISKNFTNFGGALATSSALDSYMAFDGAFATQTISGNLTGSTTLGTTTFSGAAGKLFASNASTTNFSIRSSSGLVTTPLLLTVQGNMNFYGPFGNLTPAGMLYIQSPNSQYIYVDSSSGAVEMGSTTFLGSGTKTFTRNGNVPNQYYDVTVDAASTVSFATAYVMTIRGNLTNNGIISDSGSGLAFNGTSGTQTISGAGSFSGVSRSPAFAFSGSAPKTFTLSNASSSSFFIDSTSGVVTLPSLLSISSLLTNNGSMNNNGGTVFLSSNSTNQNIAGSGATGTSAFNRLVLTGSGSKTITSNASTSDLIIESSSGEVLINPAKALSISGNLLQNGAIVSNRGGIFFSSTTGNQIISGTLTGAGSLGSTTFIGGATKSFGSNASTTDFFIDSTSGAVSAPVLLTIGGNFTNNSTFTQSSSAAGVLYFSTSTGVQSISGILTGTSALGTTTFLGAAAKTFAATSASTSDFTIDATSGTVTAPSGILTVEGNFTNNGTFANNSGTVYASSSQDATLSGSLVGTSAFNNTVIGGGSTKFFSVNSSTTNFTNAGAKLRSNSGKLFDVSGNYTSNPSGNFNSSGILEFTGSAGTQIITGDLTSLSSPFATTTFMNAAAKQIYASSVVAPTINVLSTSGTVTLRAPLSTIGDIYNYGTIDFGTSTITLSNNSIGQMQAIMGNFTGTSAFSNLVTSGRGNKTFYSNASSSDLSISGTTGNVTLTAPFSVFGNFVNTGNLNSSSTIYFASTTGTQTIAGNLTGNSQSLGSVAFVGGGAKTIVANASTTNFSVAASSGTVTLPGLISVAGDYANSGTVTSATSSIFFSGTSGTQTLAGTMTGTSALGTTSMTGGAVKSFSGDATLANYTIDSTAGGVSYNNGSTYIVTGNYVNNTTASVNASASVNFIASSTADQTLAGTMIGSNSQFGTIKFAGSGTKTFLNNASSTGNFVILAGSGAVLAPTLLTVGGFVNSGTFTHSTNPASVLYLNPSLAYSFSGNMTGTSNLGTTTIQGVNFFGGIVTMSSNASTTALTIDSGKTLEAPGLISVSGNYTNNGTFTHKSGTVLIDGNAPQTFSGTLSGATGGFNNIIVLNTSGTDAQTDPGVVFNSPLLASSTFTAVLPNTKIQFKGNATTTLANLTLNGQAAGTKVSVRSTAAGTEFGLVVSGIRSVSYTDVKDSNACSGFSSIDASDGTNANSSNNHCWTFTAAAGTATLASSAHQFFAINQASTTLAMLTVTDDPTSPVIMAATGLRIGIATSSVNARFSVIGTLTFGGSASGKVTNSITYEGGNSVAYIPVNTNFSAGDILTVSGLQLGSFNSVNASTSALRLFLDGPADIVSDASDSMKIGIYGAQSLADSDAGQTSNKLDNVSSIAASPIYTFKLTPVGESVTISSLSFDLSDMQGLPQNNFANTKLYVDYNGNGAADANDLQVGGAGVVNIPGTTGTITFTTPFTSTTTRSYVLITDISSVSPVALMTIRLSNAGITATGATTLQSLTVSGNITSITHRNLSFSRGGGSSVQQEIGGPPPTRDGDQGGGSAGGGGQTGGAGGGGAGQGGGSAGGGGLIYNYDPYAAKSAMASVLDGWNELVAPIVKWITNLFGS